MKTTAGPFQATLPDQEAGLGLIMQLWDLPTGPQVDPNDPGALQKVVWPEGTGEGWRGDKLTELSFPQSSS